MYEKKQEGGGPLKSLPNIDLNYIKNRATDTSKVVRKAQEVPNVNHIKNWLLSNNKERDLFDYCGALLTLSLSLLGILEPVSFSVSGSYVGDTGSSGGRF